MQCTRSRQLVTESLIYLLSIQFSVQTDLISVAANAFPKNFKAIYDACLSRDYELARKEQFKMSSFISEIFAEGNPGGIKTALQELGICENHLRLPLYPVSDGQKQKIVSATQGLS